MHLELDGRGALYAQLARALKRSILQGHLKAGSRLPATRLLAAELALSRNTVLTAYEVLCTEKLALSKVGSGTFVAASMAPPAASPARPDARTPTATAAVASPPQSRYAARLRQLPPLALRRSNPKLRYDLQYGEPLLDLVLVNAWRNELARAATGGSLQYPPTQGLRELRQAICEYLARRRGVLCSADDVVIVGGAQQAVSLLARVLLDEGDPVVIEDPGYPLAANALQAHGARLLPVRTDTDGLVVAMLPRGGARLVHVTPSHQFPSGAVMSLARRKALLGYAAEHRSWVIEDDYDGEFRYDAVMIPALQSLDLQQRVIYVGSFSKLLFPALRLGYVVCPRSVRDDLLGAKQLDDMGCGAVEQAAVAELMHSGGFDRHLRRATLELRRRRRTLLDGLQRHCGTRMTVADSRAGMHVVGWLPGWLPAQLELLQARALDHGLGLHPIAPLYRRPPPHPGLLLGFAGLSPAQLRAATALLGQCMEEVVAV